MRALLEKIKNLPAGVKASVAFFFASVITSGIAYIVTPIYTRLLSPDEYGQTSVFLTWVQIFGIVAMFCLHYGVFNNGMLDYKDKRDDFSFSMLVLSNIITLIFSALILALYPFIKEFIGMDLPLIILMCLLFMFQPAYNFWLARQRYELKYKSTVIWVVVCAFASPLIAVICILLFDNSRLYARLFGAELTLIFIYILFYIYLGYKNKFKVNTSYWKAALLFNLPLIPHYLSTYLLGNSNKLMISHLVSDTAAAYYSVAHSVSIVATIVWNAANSSLVPFTYENCQKKNYKAISAVVIPILTAFAAICVLVIMMAPEVIAIMATPEYREAIYVVPPLVGGVFFQMQYFIYANVVYYFKKPKYVMFASITTVVVNLVLNYFLITAFGYIAAGYTTLICYLLQAAIDYFAMKRVAKTSIYDMKYIGVLSLAIIAIALLSNLLYDLLIIRYIIVALLFIICFIKRNKIIDMFKNMKKA